MARGDAPLLLPEAARTEIRFPAPVRYAIVRQAPGEIRTLYAHRDIIFHPKHPTGSLTIERVEAKAVVLREPPRGRVHVLPVGGQLPGFPGWTVSGTVLLMELHYRYRTVDHLRHPEPVLVASVLWGIGMRGDVG